MVGVHAPGGPYVDAILDEAVNANTFEPNVAKIEMRDRDGSFMSL